MKPATQKQQEFLEILLNDAGYTKRVQRYDFISLRVGRTVSYLDDLTIPEASMLISQLKSESEEKANADAPDFDPRDDYRK